MKLVIVWLWDIVYYLIIDGYHIFNVNKYRVIIYIKYVIS